MGHGSIPEFDSYSDSYSEALRAGLKASGESQEFFAEKRIALLAERVARLDFQADTVLDFGCGQGSSTSLLLDILKARTAIGVDVSSQLLRIARAANRDSRVSYAPIAEHAPDGTQDIVYTNGVFHHITPPERPAALKYILRSLRPGGLFALWENNPWNPGTRLVMKRIPFDRDAQMLSIGAARALGESCGFETVSIDSAFFFPRFLGALRVLEPVLSSTRLGAQYLILFRKPGLAL